MCEVEQDFAGFTGSRERLTCNTHGETLVKQPYMSEAAWKALKTKFLTEHNNKKT